MSEDGGLRRKDDREIANDYALEYFRSPEPDAVRKYVFEVFNDAEMNAFFEESIAELEKIRLSLGLSMEQFRAHLVGKTLPETDAEKAADQDVVTYWDLDSMPLEPLDPRQPLNLH